LDIKWSEKRWLDSFIREHVVVTLLGAHERKANIGALGGELDHVGAPLLEQVELFRVTFAELFPNSAPRSAQGR